MNLSYAVRFVANRAAAMVVLLLIISCGVFSLLQAAPGSTERALLGAQQASPATLAAIRHQYHLDLPFMEQYWLWLKAALQGNFGHSVSTLQPVTDMIRDSIGITIFLVIYAFLLTMVTGIGLGVLAAVRSGTFVDRATVAGSLAGVSAPVFATGVLLLYVLAVKFSLFPAFGAGNGFAGHVAHLTLPAIALAVTSAGLVLKLTRTAMLETLASDYVAFARARGQSGPRILVVYALRNASVQIVTGAGLVLAYLFTGSVLVEQAFSLPGLGNLLIAAVNDKDLPTVQAVALLIAAAIIVVNFLVDVAYAVIDPRIRFGGGER